MAFLRVEKKKSGTYLRIVKSYKVNGKPRQKTLHSLGKLEDYPADQLEKIAQKLLELSGHSIKEIAQNNFKELARVNYGYALIIKKMWQLFDMQVFAAQANMRNRIKFDWEQSLQLMVAERLNEPGSKRNTHINQSEYIGFGPEKDLQHLYRTLDLLCREQKGLKQHLFRQQRSLYTQELDVVFYDVTTLYFDSQREVEGSIRQKGYSKDGQAHKVQVVLGLLVDKMRNPVTYHIYKGNTYEGHTMIDALQSLKDTVHLGKVIAVADSAMIDQNNRAFMQKNNIGYILGERLKRLPEKLKERLLDRSRHIPAKKGDDVITYTCANYGDRKVICSYSEKRARKDSFEREKLIKKAQDWLDNPGKYKQVKKRGAGRFIKTDQEGVPTGLDIEKIESDARYDGFKTVSTTTDLEISQVLTKYSDLFEVEHAFRTLKSQLEVRPVFHWTDERIEGHIAMCFVAYTFLNALRNMTGLHYRELVKSLDRMQMSVVQVDHQQELVYMRSALKQQEETLIGKLKLVAPKDTTPQSIINQYFT